MGQMTIPVKALQGDIVEIRWKCDDGRWHVQRVTCPIAARATQLAGDAA
jgi:hypothetical protein